MTIATTLPQSRWHHVLASWTLVAAVWAAAPAAAQPVVTANPLGRVQIKLPMPVSTPADTTRTLPMATALLEPTPSLVPGALL